MKWSFATVGIIVLGIIGATIIMLFEQLTTTNENDYYLLKEITESAMIDAIDLSYYRETGELKIVREKFVENFTRRFAESTTIVGTDYKIEFYDIIETPPKVSVAINTTIGDYTIYDYTSDYGVNNRLSAILEYIGKNTTASSSSQEYGNPYKVKTKTYDYYLISNTTNNSFSGIKQIKLPSELTAANIKNTKISNIKYLNSINNQGDLNIAVLKEELDYKGTIDESGYLLSINDISKNINQITEITYYNCGTSSGYSGTGTREFICKDNPYWIKINGTTNDNKSKVVLKYQVTWTYEEYEYSN